MTATRLAVIIGTMIVWSEAIAVAPKPTVTCPTMVCLTVFITTTVLRSKTPM